jgi:hypothetical protein
MDAIDPLAAADASSAEGLVMFSDFASDDPLANSFELKFGDGEFDCSGSKALLALRACFPAQNWGALILQRCLISNPTASALLNEDVLKIRRVIVEDWCDVFVRGPHILDVIRIDAGIYSVDGFAKLARFASARITLADEGLAALQDDLAEAQRRFGADRLNSAGHAIGALAGQEWTAETIAAAVAHLEMLERDGPPSRAPRWHIGPFSASDFNLLPDRPAPAGIASCASMTHKLGGWGVQS